MLLSQRRWNQWWNNTRHSSPCRWHVVYFERRPLGRTHSTAGNKYHLIDKRIKNRWKFWMWTRIRILVRTMDHVISMKSSFHSAHVLILILENIVKLKKSSLILAMDINEVQLESALQMARHTPVTAVTAVTLVTCVTFLHVIIIANVKIISLETFVKKWTHSHMHTKPQTVLPVNSKSFLLSMCLERTRIIAQWCFENGQRAFEYRKWKW